MKKISVVMMCLLALAARAQVTVIDPLNGNSLTRYTDTLVLDNSSGGGAGISFSDSSSALVASYVGTGITPEQALFLAPTNSFSATFTVGDVLTVNTTVPGETNQEDFGLAISATNLPPAAASGNSFSSRALFDWASISIRPSQNSIRINTSTNGVLTTAANVVNISNATNITQLFIQWNTTNAFSLGFVSNGVSFIAARVAFTAGSKIGNAIGFYGDIRSAGVSLGSFTNLTLAPLVNPNIIISQQPSNQTAALGKPAGLSVTAAGPGTLGYQWYFLTATSTNGIAGATNAAYNIASEGSLGVTNYYVIITNGISTPVTSVVASITVRTPSNLEWAGTGSSWDTASLNWTANGNVSQTAYTEADDVTFDNLGLAQPTVNLAQALHPTIVTVSGSASYTLTGPGSIAGFGNFVMNGSGTLLLDTTNNTYAGGTLVSSGTLQIGDGTISSGPGSGPVTNNAAMVAMPGPAGETLSNSISGTGTLTETGSGNLILTASNTYTGQTTISSGTLHARNANALGASTAPLVNTSGGDLYVDQNVNLLNPLTLGGNNVSLQKGGGGASALGGTISLASSTSLSVDSGATLNLTNASGLNGSSAAASLTLAGAGTGNISGPLSLSSGSLTVSGGTWTVAPNNNYTGLTTINGGGLFITGPLSLGPVPGSFNASDVTLNGGVLGAAANVTLNDGNIGIELGGNATISVVTNVTFVISNQISATSGAVTLTKAGPGTLILQGANPFGGNLDVDTISTTANDGTLVIANNGAIANIPVLAGVPFIFIANNNGGSSTLALNGSSGSITIAPDIQLSGRNVTVQAIENIIGNNTISGNFEITNGGGNYIFQSDAGTLNLTAPLPFNTPTNSTRTITFQGTGAILMSGGIQDGSFNGTSNIAINVIYNGPGLLSLPVANPYSGFTAISNGVLSLTGSMKSIGGVTVAGGLLAGNGSITGPVAVNGGGAIEAGATNAIGTLTLGSSLTLSGNTMVKINKTAGTHDLFTGQSSVTYGGTLTVTNLSGTLALGDSFTLFTPGASASNFSNIAGSPGAGLAYSFANGVLSVVNGIPTTPTNITFSVSGNVLTLSWPLSYKGWTLQAQTNSLNIGLGTNWVNVPNSASVTSTNITMNPAAPTVFYRLTYTH
jgi:fibronectin-binding autotransporter adhesin